MVQDLTGGRPSEIAQSADVIDGIVWLSETGRLYFSTMVNGILQVFLVDPGSGQRTQLTSTDTDTIVADASADARSVIVSSVKEESNLWRVNVTGGQEAVISRDINLKMWPAISPDNEKIVFQSARNTSGANKVLEGDIVAKTMRARDENERPTVLASNGFLPAWSPDGTSIAFLRKSGENIELFAANASGGGERRLSTGGIQPINYSLAPYNYVQTTAFSFSPDSGRIAYVSQRSGAWNIWAVSTRDGNDGTLTSNTDPETHYYCPMWSPDGTRLAYTFDRTNTSADGQHIRGLRTIDVASGASRDVLESPAMIRLIGWTADGSGLLIAQPDKASSGLPPETTLVRVSLGGARTIVAGLKNIYYYNIFLSDDRKNIAGVVRENNRDDVWVMPSSGGSLRRITANNDASVYFSRLAWFHDGSSIIFGKQTRFSLLSLVTDLN
jgi:Tol biopolymer transport system component